MIPRWLWWTFLALGSWAVWAILPRFMGDQLTPTHSQALSTLGILPVIIALGFTKKLTVTGNRRRGIIYALVGGALACAGNIAYYRMLQVGERAAPAVAMTAMYPLVTIVLALLLLGERMNKIQSVGLVLSLIAIFIFNVGAPGEGLISKWLVWAAWPILFWGVAGLVQKLATNHISGEFSCLWFLSTFVPAAVFLLWREPLPEQITSRSWGLVIALGFTFALGNLALLAALARGGKASVIVPLTALYPMVSIPIAMVLLNEKVGGREALGIVIALIAVAALSFEKPAPALIPNSKTQS